jgi:hypothetical protein
MRGVECLSLYVGGGLIRFARGHESGTSCLRIIPQKPTEGRIRATAIFGLWETLQQRGECTSPHRARGECVATRWRGPDSDDHGQTVRADANFLGKIEKNSAFATETTRVFLKPTESNPSFDRALGGVGVYLTPPCMQSATADSSGVWIGASLSNPALHAIRNPTAESSRKPVESI